MYLLNPHSLDMFKTPVAYKLVGKKPLRKYEAFFDAFIESGGKLLFDFSETSFSRVSKFWIVLWPLIFCEVLIWVIFNGVPLSKVRFYSRKHESLLIFTYKGATEKNFIKLHFLDRARTVFWHFSHYMIRTGEKSDFIKPYSDKSVVMADSDIRENLLFRKYFPFLSGRPLLLCPFVPAGRFLISKNFRDRESEKIYASGTHHNLRDDYESQDAVKVFDRYSHHYLREEIANTHHDWIDNGLGAFGEQVGAGEARYFKRDLVETFNSYSLVVCGDELCGLPAISNFEAMACGAMPIVKSENYAGLGLEAGIHYLEHDGTVESLRKFLPVCNEDFNVGLARRCDISRHLLRIVDSCINSISEYDHINSERG